MKIKELREMLTNIPAEHDDVEILLQKDEEGNGFRPASGIDIGCFIRDDDMEYIYDEDELDEDDKEDAVRVAVAF